MGQTLTHGVYLPDEGERNCYSGLAANWQILDNSVGTIAANTAALSGKAPLVHTHTKSDITDFPAYGNAAGTICEGNDSRLSDARTPVAHTHTKSDVTDLLNSNFIPSANNSYDLGSSSYQWNNLYAKNYYYNGVAWGLDKYNWWSLAQFYSQNSIHVRNVQPGVAPSSDVSAGIRFENANASYVFADIVGKVFTSGITFVNLIASNKFSNGALDPNGTTSSRSLQVGIRPDGSGFIYTDCGWRNNLIPHALDSNLNLGTSTNKWKSLNGINPGALSLPTTDSTKWVDLSGSIVVNNSYTYTPAVDGWISVELNNTNASSPVAVFMEQSAIKAACFGYAPKVTGGNFYGSACIPVRANIAVNIYARGSNAVVTSAYFMPCQGNV